MAEPLDKRAREPTTPVRLQDRSLNLERLPTCPPLPPTPTKPRFGAGARADPQAPGAESRDLPTPPTQMASTRKQDLGEDMKLGLCAFEERKVVDTVSGRKSRKRKVDDLQITMNDQGGMNGDGFRFMDLPGEIRNLIYIEITCCSKQALLTYLPKIASLRSRTRQDRGRPLPNRDPDSAPSTRGDRVNAPERRNNRPYAGLTQVNRQIRQEFRSIYMSNQEIGLDIVHAVEYLGVFYDKSCLTGGLYATKKDMPFFGNLTIAIGDKITECEKQKDGLEIFPLLDLWANSEKIEAGFGRYARRGYLPQTDEEAKDMYRLFGRRVLPDRACSPMNPKWRQVLRSHVLESVRIHRSPSGGPVYSQPSQPIVVGQQVVSAGQAIVATRPYFHVIYKESKRESWMVAHESIVSKNWLTQHGFDHMEHFNVKVGISKQAAMKLQARN